VEAFYKIGPEYLAEHGIRLILAGGGEMDNELKAMIKKYGLENYIRMEGLVSREKVPDYYKLADSYIISSDYEGTSVSLLEAMVNKSAIIGSDAPGINRMLSHGHNALLYKTTDTAELAETIKLIFSDTALAKKISDGAYNDFINKYSYELMMSRYESVFSSVLS
jgi:glycosyltransferase involved in cell wall biosynthesis